MMTSERQSLTSEMLVDIDAKQHKDKPQSPAPSTASYGSMASPSRGASAEPSGAPLAWHSVNPIALRRARNWLFAATIFTFFFAIAVTAGYLYRYPILSYHI